MRINLNKVIGLVAVTLGVALVGLNGTAAHADILPQVGTPTVSAVGGNFRYSYDVIVSGTQEVRTGDFFTIYDFAGFVGPSAAAMPANWAFFAENLSGPVVTGQGAILPNDDAGITNARFVYTGGTTLVGAQALGTFSLDSKFNVGSTVLTWVGRGTDQVTGLKNANITNVLGPQAIPEPSEWAFGAFASSSVLGLVIRARRRKMAA